jgi:hypothetical protein
VTAITIPIRTGSGLNGREAWQVRARRVRKEREDVAWLIAKRARPVLPCNCLLTRIAPSNGLDDDNLQGALKGVRDEVARWLGVDDRHRAVVFYVYAQERGPWGVRIQFVPMAPQQEQSSRGPESRLRG